MVYNPSYPPNSPEAAQRLADVKSGAVQMLGVNLGSWLVLEQYMVPNIYSLVKGNPYGERALMQARSALPCTAGS